MWRRIRHCLQECQPELWCADNVDNADNFALNGFWKPEETGFIPSVSAAYGWSDLEGSTVDDNTATWMVGLQWDKVANDSP